MNEFEIKFLEKEKWEGYILPISYKSEQAYVLSIDHNATQISMVLTKEHLEVPIESVPEDHDYSDRLYQDHWDNVRAYGILKGDELIAAIEISDESWNNRLRITELWVADKYQRQGLGSQLLHHVIEIGKAQNNRALVLETQSSNVQAINFYFKNKFELIGFDTIHYSNTDVKENTIRLELGRIIK